MVHLTMLKTLAPRLIALASFAFMLVMNVLATTLPLDGQATNKTSDRYDTLFAPIGFTFAIWGVIYLLLGVYTVVQLVADNSVIGPITPWFIAGNLLHGAWIVAWHYEALWVSALIIGALLWSLIRINKQTTATRTTIGSTLAIRGPLPSASAGSRWQPWPTFLPSWSRQDFLMVSGSPPKHGPSLS